MYNVCNRCPREHYDPYYCPEINPLSQENSPLWLQDVQNIAFGAFQNQQSAKPEAMEVDHVENEKPPHENRKRNRDVFEGTFLQADSCKQRKLS